MKILVFTGGLGNQLFGYAFYNYLKHNYPQERVYGIYNNSKMSEHNGMEVNKYFDVILPSSPIYIRLFVGLIYLLKKINIGRGLVSMDTRTFDTNTIVNNACKMHIDFIRYPIDYISFKNLKLSKENEDILKRIKSSHSAFIHIRRGDYYSPKYIKKLGGTCPKEYYQQAINYICKKDEHVQFFVFSDDMEFVKNNIVIPNPIYVDWNRGYDSYLDMYLMSNCMYSIIANSTFSYWGAMLGEKKRIVTYPHKWVNPPATAPIIFPKEWISF